MKLDYKWVALSNTTLGMLVAMINSSILLIALPDIFRGIGVDPLQPGNTSYLLWLILGFLVVMAVLLVSLGRLGDIYGRVRMFNLGFAVFTVFSILLSVTWMQGSAGRALADPDARRPGCRRRARLRELERDPHRRVPARRARPRARDQQHRDGRRLVPRARDRRPARAARRGASSSSSRCRSGSFATVWSYHSLREIGVRKQARIDWWGNVTFALGLIAVMVGITYGIQPYGGHTMGWTSPLVLALLGRRARPARACSA